MKTLATRQRCDLAQKSNEAADTKMKCVTMMVFEEAGKTILQPFVNSKEAHGIQELFQNKTLEVWLSNGQPDPAQFDISILKYKQQMQSTTKCFRTRNVDCLKNYFETIVSCDQCPLGSGTADLHFSSAKVRKG